MQVKYDKIGKAYNETRCADTFLTQRFLYYLNPQPEGLYLDVGCGTGNYTHKLQNKKGRFIGIDPSNRMLKIARAKNKYVDWRIGTAEATGLENSCAEGILCSLTLHHWNSLQKGFDELYRVLKPNGKLVIFTSTQKQMEGYWLNHYFPKMLQDSIQQMPKLTNILEGLETSGFKIDTTEAYFVKPDLEDKFLYCGKHDPQAYFDASIRNGISSFSDLSNSKEVTTGLAKLKRDIQSRTIETVQKTYLNTLGDYLFIVAIKQ